MISVLTLKVPFINPNLSTLASNPNIKLVQVFVFSCTELPLYYGKVGCAVFGSQLNAW